jgi:hypothetical protein
MNGALQKEKSLVLDTQRDLYRMVYLFLPKSTALCFLRHHCYLRQVWTVGTRPPLDAASLYWVLYFWYPYFLVPKCKTLNPVWKQSWIVCSCVHILSWSNILYVWCQSLISRWTLGLFAHFDHYKALNICVPYVFGYVSLFLFRILYTWECSHLAITLLFCV